MFNFKKLSGILSIIVTLILFIVLYNYVNATDQETRLFIGTLFIVHYWITAVILCSCICLLILPIYFLAIHLYLLQPKRYLYFRATTQPIMAGFTEILIKAIVRPLYPLYIIEESGKINSYIIEPVKATGSVI